jgi:S-DNA-T family DNA segregation ATPase FtsK/SpoIIIE
VAYTVSSQVDSRTILDQAGAERLIGRGDMLFLPIDASKPLRIQGCYVSEAEIKAVCTFWRDQEEPAYALKPVASAVVEHGGHGDSEDGADALWEDAVRWVSDRGQASTSMLQRRFSIGFQRASRLLDMMEERGIVGPRDGPRPREVLVTPHEVQAQLGRAPLQYDTGPSPDEE